MGDPRVSVILPYRDAAATIDEAIASILAQRDVALEVVAIDDGSRDDGPARVRGWASRDARVRLVATEGVGIARALRAGLDAARAPLVARMDADDVAHPDRLAAQLRALADASPRVAAIGTQVEAFADGAPHEVGEGMRLFVAWQNAIVTPDEHARALFVESPLCHPSVLLVRRALDEVGPWRDFDGPEDYDLWLRLDAAGWAMAKVPRVLLRWRHLPGRATFGARCAIARFLDAKAPHLARRVRASGRPLAVWGAGQTGKRVARALEAYGVRASRFVDVDPRKIGRTARGAPIVGRDALVRGASFVVVAVAARGARDLVRDELLARGFVESVDFLCAS